MGTEKKIYSEVEAEKDSKIPIADEKQMLDESSVMIDNSHPVKKKKKEHTAGEVLQENQDKNINGTEAVPNNMAGTHNEDGGGVSSAENEQILNIDVIVEKNNPHKEDDSDEPSDEDGDMGAAS